MDVVGAADDGELVGDAIGASVGCAVGVAVGAFDGAAVGVAVGVAVEVAVGDNVGPSPQPPSTHCALIRKRLLMSEMKVLCKRKRGRECWPTTVRGQTHFIIRWHKRI